ncbi:alanine racemase [bacterium]|nr:alanine racemase [bacterium]
MSTYDEWKQILSGIPLPAVFVDLDAFDRNIKRFVEAARAVSTRHSIRLATKSVRVPALIRRVLDSGMPFRGLMCYAATEAAFLAQQGFDDLLVAYPTRQASDVAALKQVHASGKTIRQMVDSLDTARVISAGMEGVNRPFEIAIDIDMSLRMAGGRVHLGVRRSPIRSVEQAVELIRQINRLPNLRCRSVMGYEAQVAGLADQNPFKRTISPIVRLIRQKSRSRVSDFRRRLSEQLEKEGTPLELFNGGGSGSVNFTAAEPWLTELTIGSGLLCSHYFSYFSNIAPEPACFFALQTTRSSDPGFMTCAGGGYIASGEPGWEKVPLPYLPEGLKLVSMEGCGEVQTPLIVPRGSSLKAGDPVLFRHSKAGELAEHFNQYHLVSGNQVVDVVPTYRGLGQCFLG